MKASTPQSQIFDLRRLFGVLYSADPCHNTGGVDAPKHLDQRVIWATCAITSQVAANTFFAFIQGAFQSPLRLYTCVTQRQVDESVVKAAEGAGPRWMIKPATHTNPTRSTHQGLSPETNASSASSMFFPPPTMSIVNPAALGSVARRASKVATSSLCQGPHQTSTKVSRHHGYEYGYLQR